MSSNFRFHYLIATEPEDLSEPSFFWGFTPEVIRVAPLVMEALRFPAHPIELVVSRDDAIQQRIMGSGRWVSPLQTTALSALQLTGDRPFWCIISTDETVAEVSRWCSEQRFPVLHLSTASAADTVPLKAASLDVFREHAIRVFEYIGTNSGAEKKLKASLLEPPSSRQAIALEAEARSHGTTIPNELLLESFAYTFRSTRALSSTDEDDYVEAILASAKLVVQERHRIFKQDRSDWIYPPPTDLVVATASMYRLHYSSDAPWKLIRAKESKPLKEILRAATQQSSYMTMLRSDQITDGERMRPELSLLEMMGEEIRPFNAACAARAAQTFAPVVRLPPRVNHLQEELRKIGACVRRAALGGAGAQNKAEIKKHRLTGALAYKLERAIPSKLQEFIRENGRHIKLIGDAPVEFLPVEGLPLAMARETSRVNATPGNLLLQQCSTSRQLVVDSQAFTEVLVVRSFSEGDPLKHMLEEALGVVLKGEESRTRVRFVDVASRDEFVTACNDYDGMILIFDGHGAHDAHSDVGALLIGGKPLDVWSLRGAVRIPPIVILSACDTHPHDRSHASTANGFLNIGAITVLSTILPIDGREAAVFLGRLVYRLAAC